MRRPNNWHPQVGAVLSLVARGRAGRRLLIGASGGGVVSQRRAQRAEGGERGGHGQAAGSSRIRQRAPTSRRPAGCSSRVPPARRAGRTPGKRPLLVVDVPPARRPPPRCSVAMEGSVTSGGVGRPGGAGRPARPAGGGRGRRG